MPISQAHKAPTLIACIPLMIGIQLSKLYDIPIQFCYYTLIALIISLIGIQFIKTRRRSALNIFHLFLIIAIFFIIGFFRHQQVNKENDFEGPIKAKFTAIVLNAPIEKSKTYRVDLLVDSAYVESKAYPLSVNIIAYIAKSSEFENLTPGKIISFESLLNPPSEMKNPEDFDYKAFLQRKSIYATTYIPSDSWQILKKEHLSFKILAARVQCNVVDILKNLNYEEKELAVLSALTVGYKQLIDNDQRQAYIAAGSSHILAVSGLHVGILFLFLSRIFSILGKSRRSVMLRLILIIILLWCFAFITGLTPSVTRATLMFSLVSIGVAGRQRSSIFNNIYLSAFILLLINPHLLFDIGFQLSYSAVLAIVALEPYISSFFINKLRIPKFFSELMAVSIAAQLGTAPISIHAFNCFPNYFLLTNIWIIPIVGVIVNASIIVILLAFLGLPTGWIAIPLGWLLKIMNFGVEFISSLPNALNSFLYIDILTVVLIFTAILFLIFALESHSKHYLYSILTVIIVTISYNIYSIEKGKDKQQLMIINDKKSFNICVRQGLRSNVLMERDSSFKMPSYFTHHYLAKHTINAEFFSDYYHNYNLMQYRDFIITPQHLHCIFSHSIERYSAHMEVSSLILHKEEPTNIYRLYERFRFSTLVIYQRPEKHINYYRNFCKKNGIKLHLVYKDGAYYSSL